MLPQSFAEPLQQHLEQVKSLHKPELAEGFGKVYLPFEPERKCIGAACKWGWPYVFPARRHSIDRRRGKERRRRIEGKTLQEAMKKTVRALKIPKPGSCDTSRHGFATHLQEARHDRHTAQVMFDHKGSRTTMIYT